MPHQPQPGDNADPFTAPAVPYSEATPQSRRLINSVIAIIVIANLMGAFALWMIFTDEETFTPELPPAAAGAPPPADA